MNILLRHTMVSPYAQEDGELNYRKIRGLKKPEVVKLGTSRSAGFQDFVSGYVFRRLDHD